MNKDLAEFAGDSLDSIWSLEMLLALYQEPARIWSAEELKSELRSSQLVVSRSIGNLLASCLIVAEAEGLVRYGPASTDLDHLVRQLVEAYRIKPAAVRRLIVRSSSDRLRSFSNAFKISKD